MLAEILWPPPAGLLSESSLFHSWWISIIFSKRFLLTLSWVKVHPYNERLFLLLAWQQQTVSYFQWNHGCQTPSISCKWFNEWAATSLNYPRISPRSLGVLPLWLLLTFSSIVLLSEGSSGMNTIGFVRAGEWQILAAELLIHYRSRWNVWSR